MRRTGCWITAAALAAPAVAATHLLECRTQGGERFELRSDYSQRLFPALTPLNSATYDHQPWRVRYFDARGQEHSNGLQEVRVAWHGDAAWALERYCANFGVVNGQALGPLSYLGEQGRWIAGAVSPRHPALSTEQLREALKPDGELGRAGFTRVDAQRLGFSQGLLFHEVALFVKGHDAAQHPMQAVYQSQSADGGQHWSEPVVRDEGRLFEVGRPLPAHCSAARPVRYERQPLPSSPVPGCPGG